MSSKEGRFGKQNKQFNEAEIQQRLYGKKTVKSPHDAFITDTEVLDEQITIDIGISQELNNLKKTLARLEEKLKKTEWQKERLKRKLLQRRIFNNIQGKFGDIITGRQPGWLFIMLPIILLLFLFAFLFFSPRQKQSVQIKAGQKLTANNLRREAVTGQNEKPVPKKVKTADRTYTLQVAEYADTNAAKLFVQNLESQGYLVMVNTTYRNSNMEKPYFKIDVGIFKSLSEAKEFKQEFKMKTGIKDSFIKDKK